MERSRTGRVVPGLLMTAAVAVPILTTAELVVHASTGPATTPLASTSTTNRSGSGSTTAAAGTGGAKAAGSAAPGVHVYTGPAVQDPFGTVQAQVTLNGSKITNVSITAPMDNPRSAGINTQAIPMLKSETLQAQSAQVSLISGATYTSQAYQQSLQGALSQSGSPSRGSSSVALAPSSGKVSVAGSDD